MACIRSLMIIVWPSLRHLPTYLGTFFLLCLSDEFCVRNVRCSVSLSFCRSRCLSLLGQFKACLSASIYIINCVYVTYIYFGLLDLLFVLLTLFVFLLLCVSMFTWKNACLYLPGIWNFVCSLEWMRDLPLCLTYQRIYILISVSSSSCVSYLSCYIPLRLISQVHPINIFTSTYLLYLSRYILFFCHFPKCCVSYFSISPLFHLYNLS